MAFKCIQRIETKFIWILIFMLAHSIAMQLDPERVAARLRIEQAIRNDRLALSRNRRQLGGTPKEETIQVTAQLFSGRLFDYGVEAGDREIPAQLDSAKKLHISHPINYYGKEYSSIYILSNGAIGFDSLARSYRANILPGNIKLIAPFWNRNDLRNGGHVYFREITSGRVLERGQSEIRYQYDMEVVVESAIIATWDKMQPLGTTPLPDENTNTFQVAIFLTKNGTFANFIYSNIGWTQGAESGFSNGDNTNYYALPTSGTGNIMYLEDYGNTGIPGEWMFVFGEKQLIRCKAGIKGDTCDETCAAGEWGADCAECCHCENGAECNNISGACNKNNNVCADCWTGSNCQEKLEKCKNQKPLVCAANAISFTDYDRCGEPTQRCDCLAGYEGNGNDECKDIDECAQPGTCHEKAICTNTPGRFFCQCISGFNGDGVSECVASFLYPQNGAKRLKKTKNAKVTWQLKYPLKIFGKTQEKLIISSNGLIIVSKEKARVNPDDRLDDVSHLGIAPFYAPIDLSAAASHGEVSIVESTDIDVLARATQSINENLMPNEATFRATSVVTISYMNVSTLKTAENGNTFQTLLIGGTNRENENITFAQFLYKDLVWSDGAEAGIMTLDKTNSIHLPGSGTAGIEQLSQLSNIRAPGIWLYRIDNESVQPCMQNNLQPPYCDAQTPTLIGQRRLVTRPTNSFTTTIASSQTLKSKTQKNNNDLHSINFSTESSRTTPSVPIVESRQEVSEKPSQREFPQFPSNNQNILSHKSKSRKPIIPISSREIAEMPLDSFDFTPVPITIVPEIITLPPTTTTEFSTIDNSINLQTIKSKNIIQKIENIELKNLENIKIPVPSPSIIQPEIIRPEIIQPEIIQPEIIRPEIIRPELNKPLTQTPLLNIDISTNLPKELIKNVEKINTNNSAINNEKLNNNQINSESEITSTLKTEIVTQPSQFIVTRIENNNKISGDSSEKVDQKLNTNIQTTSSSSLFVFSTTTKPKPQKPKLVIGPQKPKQVQQQAAETDLSQTPYDPDRILDAEAPASKLVLILTLSMIAVWLIIIIAIGAYFACKRRHNQDMLRAMYGPAYQIRPIGVGYTMRGEKSYETYEDHLEKAARLSTEIGSYNPNGKISFHGSFWNLSRDSNCSSGQSAISSDGGDNNLPSPNETTTTTTIHSIPTPTKINCGGGLINAGYKPGLNYSNKVDNNQQARRNYRRNNNNNNNNNNINYNTRHFSPPLTINDDLSSPIFYHSNLNQNYNSNSNFNNNYYNRHNNYHQQQLISPPINTNNAAYLPYLVTQRYTPSAGARH